MIFVGCVLVVCGLVFRFLVFLYAVLSWKFVVVLLFDAGWLMWWAG